MWLENSLRGNLIPFGYHGTVAILLIALTTVVTLLFRRYRDGRKLPPGPVGLPVVGYYLSLRKDPLKKMSDLAKKYGNVFGFYIGPQYIVFVNDWEAMTEAYGQPTSLYRPPELFAAVPFQMGFSGANGEKWIHTRRMSTRTMKDIGLNKSDWEELVHEEVLDLVHRIEAEGGKPIQVRPMFAESFLCNIVTMILGKRLPLDHPIIKTIMKGVDAIIDYTPTLDMINYSPTLRNVLYLLGLDSKNLLAENTLDFANFVSDAVDEILKNPPQDAKDSFIGRFLEEIKNKENDKNSYNTVYTLKGNVQSLLVGGGETTRSTIIWALIAMAENPDIQRKVHEELDANIDKDGFIRWKDRSRVPYTLACFFETMRWRTLVPLGTLRMASEDMFVQGYRIPKGTFISSNNWLIHNDPRYWDRPDEFIPERFLLEDGKKVNTAPDSFNPFSYGKRSCPGKLIAEMEGLLYFVVLMQKFKVVPKSGQKVEHDALLGITYQPLNAELRFIAR